MADKRLVTTGNDYEAGGSVARAFLEEFQKFLLFSRKKNQKKEKRCKLHKIEIAYML